ncbi:azurin [Luteimonas sp. 22616]|jgi:azurin|uniref:azurin n=1 Tax=Luteimonas sp. 22616 TaxID=3453951 RepID=UPI003F84A0C0
MNTRITLLTAACALALVACGDKSPDTSADTAAAPTASEPAPDATAPDATTEPAPAITPTPADTTTAASAATTPGSDKPAAVVADCATEIEGTDAMQYNVGSIVVPASCTEFKITLKHTGTMPVAAMGHNVVITKAADMQAVAAEGMGAGAAAAYVKAGDARVIAHSSLIGGGETTSVSFPVSKIKDGGPYEFFCSFPGHSALMKGTIAVE